MKPGFHRYIAFAIIFIKYIGMIFNCKVNWILILISVDEDENKDQSFPRVFKTPL